MPNEQEGQPEAEPQIPAEADLGQPGDGPSESPEASVDAYVESLGMKYDDELNMSVVSDEMLPQVAARLAQTNPEAARRMALRHSDYTQKSMRSADDARAVQDEKAQLEQMMAASQYQQPQTPPTDYGVEYADPAVAQLRQEQEQMKRGMQDMYTQMNIRDIQQGLDEVQRRHSDMTAPGAREGLLQFQHKSGIRDSEQAYWAMKGPDAVAKALAAEKPAAPAAPQVPPSGSGPAKTEPPKTPEGARAGIASFLRKHGVGKLEDL